MCVWDVAVVVVDVGLWLVVRVLVLVLVVGDNDLCALVFLDVDWVFWLWEDVSEGELVELELREGLVTVNDSGITLSCNIRAIAGLNLDDLRFFFSMFVFVEVLLFFFCDCGLSLWEVRVDVSRWLFLLRFLVELVVLWVVDGVSIEVFLGWGVELIWLEELSEVLVVFLWLHIDVVVLVCWDVREETWGLVGDWSGNEWLWLSEVNPCWSLVVEVVVPVSWGWLPDWLLEEFDVTSVVLFSSYIVAIIEVFDVGGWVDDLELSLGKVWLLSDVASVVDDVGLMFMGVGWSCEGRVDSSLLHVDGAGNGCE